MTLKLNVGTAAQMKPILVILGEVAQIIPEKLRVKYTLETVNELI